MLKKVQAKIKKAEKRIAAGESPDSAGKAVGLSAYSIRKYLRVKPQVLRRPKLVELEPQTQGRLMVIVGTPSDVAETMRGLL